MSKNGALLGVGVTGFVLSAVCCATPALVLLLSAVGASALTGYLDYILLPELAVFAGIIAYALYRRRRTADCRATQIPGD